MSEFPVEDDPEPVGADKPRKRQLKAGPIKPGQFLLNKPQLLELCGDPAFSTVWSWMQNAGFPKPIVSGPPEGRTSRVAWIASEVIAWLKARPRRAIGGLKEQRAAQEKRPAQEKRAPSLAALPLAARDAVTETPRVKPAARPKARTGRRAPR